MLGGGVPPGSLSDEPDQDVIFFTHFHTLGGGGGGMYSLI